LPLQCDGAVEGPSATTSVQIHRIPTLDLERSEGDAMEDAATVDAGAAERVYSSPDDALRAAREVLAAEAPAPSERAGALLVLGRAAYYANQIADAVRLLSEAIPLAGDPEQLT
jgi:hypothetical protein